MISRSTTKPTIIRVIVGWLRCVRGSIITTGTAKALPALAVDLKEIVVVAAKFARAIGVRMGDALGLASGALRR